MELKCFHFNINVDGNLVVSLQMCKPLDFTDLYEKESRSTFHFTQKRYKDNIGTSVRKVSLQERK